MRTEAFSGLTGPPAEEDNVPFIVKLPNKVVTIVETTPPVVLIESIAPKELCRTLNTLPCAYRSQALFASVGEALSYVTNEALAPLDVTLPLIVEPPSMVSPAL